MATINQVADGLKILCGCGNDGDLCNVAVLDGWIIAGIEEDVSPIAGANLRDLGWTVGEFGWGIHCG